jgi:hypothetical protein
MCKPGKGPYRVLPIWALNIMLCVHRGEPNIDGRKSRLVKIYVKRHSHYPLSSVAISWYQLPPVVGAKMAAVF